MASANSHHDDLSIPSALRRFSARIAPLFRQVLTQRGFLVLAGILVCFFSVGVLLHVLRMPDLGLRSAFSKVIKSPPKQYFRSDPPGKMLIGGEEVVQLGDLRIRSWPDLLSAPRRLHDKIREAGQGTLPWWAMREERDGEEVVLIRAEFQRPGADGMPGETIRGWCALCDLPLEELAPTILWFFLKLTLFVVGALVFWKRPHDRSAALFFLLCIVTLGAYMGGYHWSHIATQPLLVVIFMICSVLLPVVSLHFYLVFPRPKALLQQHPRLTLAAAYGLPVAFLVTLMVLYWKARWLVQTQAPAADVTDALDLLRRTIYLYFGVAALWYLACIGALVHSYRSSQDDTELNQVKCILAGVLLALVLIGYSLYLAVWRPDEFSTGAATWPMFGVSVFMTIAFTVSITRYRLMELDKIVSSGVGYFLISFLAGLVYYAVVFLGTLVFSQMIASPSLSQALTVSTTALLLMLGLDLARSRVKKVLDRRFSREKYQLDRTLQRMGQAIEQLVDPPTLANRLLNASAELLGVSRGAVYLRQGEPPVYCLAGCLGPAPGTCEIASGSPLIAYLHEEAALTCPLRAGIPLTPAQRQLQLLGGELAHGLAHEGELLALLVLGPKDRAPYQTEDLNFLTAFAQITVLALESAQRRQTIEVLNRELQTKVEKIAEQQQRILLLQSQLRKQSAVRRRPPAATAPAADGGRPATGMNPAPPGNGAAPGANLAATANIPIVGSSPQLRQLLHLVQKVARNDKTVVLIRGESGTGKELLAQAVHDHSPRAGKAFVKVHCAALSPTLLESELFGHVKGAFTGAHRDKVGRFELAHGGTLFLDEIGDISLDVQTKLLRVLEELTFERVGSSEPVKVDVRILAATHQDLEGLIRQGRFREDLYYRLNVFPIHVPPLRERWQDIPELTKYFLHVSTQRGGKAVTEIDDDALAILKSYSWPGNVRQLENVIERAVVIAEGPAIQVQDLPEDLVRAVDALPLSEDADGLDEDLALLPLDRVRLQRQERHQREKEELLRALAAADGNKAEAARVLGLARSTLISRLKKHGLG